MYILKIQFISYKPLQVSTFLHKKIIQKFKIQQKIIICKQKKIVVLKSPHVNKKSREHFLYQYYIQKISIPIISSLTLINLILFLKKNKNIKIKFNIQYVYSLIG